MRDTVIDDSAGGATQAPEPAAHATRIRLRAFSRSLPMALLRAREAAMRHFRPSLRTFGLTEQQWRVLRALASITDIEVTRLAHATCLLAPSLSRILRDLEARGLILRRSAARDMRLGIVSISPAGLALIERAGAYSELIYAEMGRRFGAAKLAALMDMLADLESLLAAGPPIEGAPVEATETGRRQRGRPKGRAAKP